MSLSEKIPLIQVERIPFDSCFKIKCFNIRIIQIIFFQQKSSVLFLKRTVLF